MLRLLPAAGLMVLVAHAPEVTELAFRPAAGMQLSLDFDRVLRFELESSEMTTTYDGEVQEGEEAPGIELVMVERETLAFRDRFEVRGGEVLGVERRFETIGNDYRQEMTDPAGESFEHESQGESDLEGESVRFERQGVDEEFGVRFAEEESELDERLLEGLVASAWLAEFLPEEEVEPDDEWEVDAAAFISMTNLSGDLHVVQEGEDPEESGDYGDQFDENIGGEITATFMAWRETEGRRLAVLSLEMELETRIEKSSEVDEEEVKGTEEEQHSIAMDLEGELLWDAEQHLPASLSLAGDLTLEVEVERSYTFGEHEIVIAGSQEFLGSIEFEVSYESE